MPRSLPSSAGACRIILRASVGARSRWRRSSARRRRGATATRRSIPSRRTGEIGFYRARTHEVIDTRECLLVKPEADAAAEAVRQYMRDFRAAGYDERTGRGLLRHVYVRSNTKGESLICLLVNGKRLPHEAELVERLRRACPKAVGIVLGENTRRDNVILGERYRTLWGADRLEDVLCGRVFRLSVPSFYQVNREQAERLYAKAIEYAQLTGEETVLDLYCGAGTITLALASHAKRVLGAEIVPEAIDDARENAARSGVENAEFFCGDASDVAKKLAQENLRPDVITVDPPRKGLAEDVVESIARMQPERVVYVSCDSATMARDVKRFAALGYRAVRACAVDLFPRADHVETVVLLSKLKVDHHIEIELKMDELDLTAAESKATYDEIKAYVLNKYGLKVSQLYIAQIKRKCGIIERKNYNVSKKEDAKVPQCPPEKEAAIMDALKHFQMI